MNFKLLLSKVGAVPWLVALTIATVPGANFAHALPSFTATDLSRLSNADVSTLVASAAIGFDHRPYQSARSLGISLGLDIGVELTTLEMTDLLDTAIRAAGVSTKIPAYLPIPKANIVKGLPFGLDASFSYIGYRSNRVLGYGLQWHLVSAKRFRPDIAIRGGYSRSNLFFLKTRGYSGDVVVSNRYLYVFEPFVGVGYQSASGSLSTELSGPQGLAVNVDSSAKVRAARYFGGLQFNLLILRLVGQYERSFAGFTTYGVKLALSL